MTVCTAEIIKLPLYLHNAISANSIGKVHAQFLSSITYILNSILRKRYHKYTLPDRCRNDFIYSLYMSFLSSCMNYATATSRRFSQTVTVQTRRRFPASRTRWCTFHFQYCFSFVRRRQRAPPKSKTFPASLLPRV